MSSGDTSGTEIEAFWRAADRPSHKFLHYFPVYEHLFAAYRGKEFTFVEFGVQGGGSLQMWRSYFGDAARIIGVDLNPQAAADSPDFDVRIGDQGDPAFLDSLFEDIGGVDVLLDDGGHQSFQQILTVERALAQAMGPMLVVVEDTATSFDRTSSLFHLNHSFLSFAKATSDWITARSMEEAGGASPLDSVWSVEFFNGIVAFRADPTRVSLDRLPSELNRPRTEEPGNFMYDGKDRARVHWPSRGRSVTVRGRPEWWSTLTDVKRKALNARRR